MLVTVIIPCYNAEKHIEKCLDSVLRQTYKKLEIILHEDCSKDNTRKKLKELEKKDSRIKLSFGKENYGCGGAKTEGIKKATGDYIMFLDSDDYISENYIEDMVKVAKENKELDIIATNFTKIDQDGNIAYVRDFKNDEIALWQKITSWGKLFKKSWLDQNNLTLPYGQVLDDVLFHMGCVLADPKMRLIQNSGYYYIFNSNSISHTGLKQFKEGALDLSQKYLLDLKRFATTKEKEELLSYFAFKFTCWHLLKSGSNVGKEAMMTEYNQAFSFLEKEFPNFKKNKYISVFHPQKERKIVFFVMYNTKLLYKLHLSKFFFKLYSRMNLGKLWPNL